MQSMFGLERRAACAQQGFAQGRLQPRRQPFVPAVSQATEVASEQEVMIRRRPPEGKARQPCAPLLCLEL